ncbi:hypothetical protein MIND_00104400 [Mycena indigotica]|uniref:Uncharacterized protein n=1 Tax=Mycena indigotica TaxID=2126181 RepID=A0A8H6WKM3_9AGAR|nr:uncharacterized protein MIND_00104400 [Mycena indigotica]KAF7315879.1 hypothetical protein MIND_00104400 [Mycena indigotica]
MSKRGEGPSSDMPPGKRPRLMAQPDGFSKPRPPKLAAPPKFASAFDGMETDRLDKRAAESASKAQKPQQKPFPTFSAFDSALKKPSSRPNGLPPAAQHARPMKSAPKPPVPLFNPAPPPSPPRARIRQPPPLPVPTPPPVEFSALRQMKLDPPPIPITPPKPSTTLKNLVPPRVPVVPATSIPPEKLRTINTTMLARTTDIFSESGPSELASLLLDYHAEVDEWATPHALEEKRGLIVSPEKANAKGKEKEKFVRGGLAAWARSFYDARESARSLWEKDTMRLISSLATRRVSSLLSLNPDMRLRVKHILHVPQLGFHQKPKADLSIPGIALCHIIAAPTVTDADPHEAPPPPLERQRMRRSAVLRLDRAGPDRLRHAPKPRRLYGRPGGICLAAVADPHPSDRGPADGP